MKTLFLILGLYSSAALAEQKNVTTGGNGRYQLIQLSSMRRDQYLLDTQTGKLRSMTCAVPDPSGEPGSCKYTVWTIEDVEGITVSSEEIEKRVERVQKLINKRPSSKIE